MRVLQGGGGGRGGGERGLATPRAKTKAAKDREFFKKLETGNRRFAE